MKTCLIRASMAALGIFLCAVIAIFTPPLWEGAGVSDFRPQGTKMAFLILVLAAVLRIKNRWRAAEFVLGLLAAEAVTLMIISYFSGFTWGEIFELFNLRYLLSISLFIAPPWILGFGLGSLWLWYREKYAKRVA